MTHPHTFFITHDDTAAVVCACARYTAGVSYIIVHLQASLLPHRSSPQNTIHASKRGHYLLGCHMLLLLLLLPHGLHHTRGTHRGGRRAREVLQSRHARRSDCQRNTYQTSSPKTEKGKAHPAECRTCHDKALSRMQSHAPPHCTREHRHLHSFFAPGVR